MSTPRPRVVIVVTSPLAHRRIFHSTFLEEALRHVDLEVWCRPSACEARPGLTCRPLPDLASPHGATTRTLQRLTAAAWDHTLRLPSRLDVHRISQGTHRRLRHRLARGLGCVAAWLRLAGPLERWVLRRRRRATRLPEVASRLEAAPPAAVVVTWPHTAAEQGVAHVAASRGIPVIASVLSFDNLTTKGRLYLPVSRAWMWSARMAAEWDCVHPRLASIPRDLVGASQFDPFHDPAMHRPREPFLRELGLDPAGRVVLLTLGSPRFLEERPLATQLAEAVRDGTLGPGVQLVVRLHPIFEEGDAPLVDAPPDARIVVQIPPSEDRRHRPLTTEDIVQWVNTFRHADVVVNLASSTALDGAVAGVPVVNVDFEPDGSGRQADLIQRINHTWPHVRPIVASGGVRCASDPSDLLEQVRDALAHPASDRAAREAMAAEIVGPLDGRAGARMARALTQAVGVPQAGFAKT